MQYIVESIQKKIRLNPFGRPLGLIRTLLAMSLIITFSMNSVTNLFRSIDGEMKYPICNNFSNKFTYFCLMPHENYKEIAFSKNILILLLCIIILGYLPQILGVIHFWIAYSVQNSMSVIDGGEQVGMVICFWLMLLSLFDNRLNHWNLPKETKRQFPIPWAIIFVTHLQISYLYLNSAISKMKNTEWLDGTAVYYYMNDSMLGLPDTFYQFFAFILESPSVALITWGTLLIQLILAAAIFSNQKVKNIIFIFAILMHEIFALFLGLVSFSIIMFATLLLYLQPLNKNYGGIKNEKYPEIINS